MLNETQSSAQPPYVYLSIHTEVLNLNLDQNLEIDILGLEDIQSFLNAHALKLNFPEYYGKNIDAWRECMEDSSVILSNTMKSKSMNIIYRNVDQLFAELSDADIAKLFTLLIDTSVYWAVPVENDSRYYTDHESIFIRFILVFNQGDILKKSSSIAEAYLQQSFVSSAIF